MAIKELEDWQRLLLINQYEILKRLEAEKPDRVKEYEESIVALREGHVVDYPTVHLGRELPRILFDEVHDVLQLYSFLHAYWDENPLDKEVSGHPYAIFKGYAWNEESDHAAVLQAILDDAEKYPSLQGREHNAMRARAPIYRAMVEKFHEFRSVNLHGKNLTKQQALEILEAGRTAGRR